MNKKYIMIALYHTVISYQLELVIEALEELIEYNPSMQEVLDLMKKLKIDLEDEGRTLLEEIEKGDEDAN